MKNVVIDEVCRVDASEDLVCPFGGYWAVGSRFAGRKSTPHLCAPGRQVGFALCRPATATVRVHGIASDAVVRVQRSTTPGAKRMTVDPVLRTDNHHGPSGDSSCCCSMLGHLTTSLVS